MSHTRQQDERLLDMIGCRVLGYSINEIASRMGCGRNVVSRQTLQVLKADKEHSEASEQAEIVRAYWKH